MNAGVLTRRQHQVLRILHARAPETPSIREIAGTIGAGGAGWVVDVLRRLERDGYIARGEGRPRPVTLLRDAPPQAPLTREQGLAFARAWRERMKPYFDGLYGPEA